MSLKYKSFQKHYCLNYFTAFFHFSDANFFTTVNNTYCKSSYQTELGFANATSKCKEDTNCAMVSTLECTKEDSIYGLCNRSTELIPKLEACTLWKIGNKTTSEIPKRVNIFKSW